MTLRTVFSSRRPCSEKSIDSGEILSQEASHLRAFRELLQELRVADLVKLVLSQSIRGLGGRILLVLQ